LRVQRNHAQAVHEDALAFSGMQELSSSLGKALGVAVGADICGSIFVNVLGGGEVVRGNCGRGSQLFKEAHVFCLRRALK